MHISPFVDHTLRCKVIVIPKDKRHVMVKFEENDLDKAASRRSKLDIAAMISCMQSVTHNAPSSCSSWRSHTMRNRFQVSKTYVRYV